MERSNETKLSCMRQIKLPGAPGVVVNDRMAQTFPPGGEAIGTS